MSKPSWDEAPEWAQFLAMDRDWEWYWYENEPDSLEFNACWGSLNGRTQFAGRTNPLWRESKEKRP